jgi:hypothetical protein
VAFGEVGHPDPVGEQRVQGIAGPADHAGCHCRAPEAVGRPGEAVAGVSGDEARVEPADEQAHRRSDGVGQRPRPPGRRVEEVVLLVLVDGNVLEPGPGEHVAQRRRAPATEEAARQVVCRPCALTLARGERDHQRGAGDERPVQARQGEGEMLSLQVQVGVACPGAAEAAIGERQRGDIGAQRSGVRIGLPRQLQHRSRGVEGEHRAGKAAQVRARPAAEVGDGQPGPASDREDLGPSRVAPPRPQCPVALRLAFVDLHRLALDGCQIGTDHEHPRQRLHRAGRHRRRRVQRKRLRGRSAG